MRFTGLLRLRGWSVPTRPILLSCWRVPPLNVMAPVPRAPGAPICKFAAVLMVTPPSNTLLGATALIATVPPLLTKLMLCAAMVLLTAPICSELPEPVSTWLFICRVLLPVPRRKMPPLGVRLEAV